MKSPSKSTGICKKVSIKLNGLPTATVEKQYLPIVIVLSPTIRVAELKKYILRNFTRGLTHGGKKIIKGVL